MPTSPRKSQSVQNIHYLEIISRLDALSKIQDDLSDIKARLDRREHLDKLIQDHQEAIKGNGKPGLEKEMAIVQEREAKRDRREWFIYTLLVSELIGIALLYFQG